ncbi:hypothetical protein OROHE_006886 [Orobanche hederae]
MEAVKVRKFFKVFNDFFAEPLTPLGDSWPRNDEEEVSPNECSPGLLDMYSFDTNLLPEWVNRCKFLYDGPPINHFFGWKKLCMSTVLTN